MLTWFDDKYMLLKLMAVVSFEKAVYTENLPSLFVNNKIVRIFS